MPIHLPAPASTHPPTHLALVQHPQVICIVAVPQQPVVRGQEQAIRVGKVREGLHLAGAAVGGHNAHAALDALLHLSLAACHGGRRQRARHLLLLVLPSGMLA
jgi:hypothetical protein